MSAADVLLMGCLVDKVVLEGLWPGLLPVAVADEVRVVTEDTVAD